MDQGKVIARRADPGLPAKQIAGAARLADLRQRDRDADVRIALDRPPVPLGEGILIRRRSADGERALGEQAVERLAEPRGSLEPALRPFRPAASDIGARGPVMAGGDELVIA